MAGWTKSKAAGKNGAKAFFVKSGFWLQVLFILSIKIGIWGIVSLRVETKWPNYMLLSYTMHHPPPAPKNYWLQEYCGKTELQTWHVAGELEENNYICSKSSGPGLSAYLHGSFCICRKARNGNSRRTNADIWQEKWTSSFVGLINAICKELVSTVPFLFGVFLKCTFFWSSFTTCKTKPVPIFSRSQLCFKVYDQPLLRLLVSKHHYLIFLYFKPKPRQHHCKHTSAVCYSSLRYVLCLNPPPLWKFLLMHNTSQVIK